MVDEFKSNEVAMLHKGKKVSSYTLKYKLEAIAYAENNNISSASKKFNVDRKRIREWKDKKEELLSLKNRLEGAGCNLSIRKWKKFLLNGFMIDGKKDCEFLAN